MKDKNVAAVHWLATTVRILLRRVADLEMHAKTQMLTKISLFEALFKDDDDHDDHDDDDCGFHSLEDDTMSYQRDPDISIEVIKEMEEIVEVEKIKEVPAEVIRK